MTHQVHSRTQGVPAALLAKAGGWDWATPRRPEHFRRCNFCGSIHPEDLVAEPNWQAEWADMKYGWPHKFYAVIPDRNGQLDCLGSSNSKEQPYPHWKRVVDLTDSERAACSEWVLSHQTWATVGTRKTHHAKFYTEHLADPNIDQAVKDVIQQRSGLIFDWLEDGRVAWRPAS